MKFDTLDSEMENEANDHVARNSDNISLVTLDLFDEYVRPAPNTFELSDVRLVHESGNTYDHEEESYLSNDLIAEESFSEPRIVETNISNDLLVSKFVDDVDDSSGGIETDKNVEGFLKEGLRSLTISDKRNNDISAILEEDEKQGEDEDKEEEEEYEVTTEAAVGRVSRTSRKFTFASDIEEVDEEMEEYEISTSEGSQRPDAEEEIRRARDAELYITETRLTRAKSRMIDRAASILEQRLKIIHGLKELYEERKKLLSKNRFLNEKCCAFIKKTTIKKTTVDLFENTEGALPIHGSQRYHAVLEEYIATKIDYEKTKPLLEGEIEGLTDSYQICQTRFDQVYEGFRLRELEIGFQCVNRKTGKLLGEQRAKSLVMKQHGRFNDLANVRVYYLKLNHRLAYIYAKVHELNLMGEGHTLMDYEELTIENSSHVDKLEEREKELLKLREKCAEYISILSHMKETSDVSVYDIMNASAKLAEIAEKKSEARTLLAIERSKRDSLRKTTSRIRHSSGLLGSPTMLRKMEVDSEALDVLKQKAQRLMENYAISDDPDNVAVMPEK